MDFTKFFMVSIWIIVAWYLIGLLARVLIGVFPLVLQLQDLFIGIFKLLWYHSSSMVLFGTSVLLYLSLNVYFLAKSIISN